MLLTYTQKPLYSGLLNRKSAKIKGAPMKISYKPLWKLLIDRDMKKKDLCDVAGISPASVTKMGKNGFVTTETLEKICSTSYLLVVFQ